MNSPPNFDRLAHIYRWLEFASFGTALWRCRSHFLDELRGCRRALVLGDGDGRFTARLLEVNPTVEVDAIDASAAMLRVLIERAGEHRRRVRTWCGDIREWQPGEAKYDLVASHFFLDCLTTGEVGALAGRVRACILPDAWWLISEFAAPENVLGKVVAKPLIRGLYLAFRALTGLRVQRLPHYEEVLTQQELRCAERKLFLGGILVTELWSGRLRRLLHSC